MSREFNSTEQLERVSCMLRKVEKSARREAAPVGEQGVEAGLGDTVQGLAELKLFADRHGMTFLAYLIDMALLEAVMQLDELIEYKD